MYVLYLICMSSISYVCPLSHMYVLYLICMSSISYVCPLSHMYVLYLICMSSISYVCPLSHMYVLYLICMSSISYVCPLSHMYVLYLIQYCTYFKIINCYRNLCFRVLKNVGKFSASVLTIVRPKDCNKEILHKTYSNN